MKTHGIALFLFASAVFAQPQTVTTTATQTITGQKTFSGSNKLCLKDPSDTDVLCLNAPALASSTVSMTLPAGFGTGVATWLATPTGANLVSALSSGGGTANFLRADGAFASPSGAGDVVGPASATDGAFALFDGTTGKLLKNSSAPGSGVMTFLATPSSANLRTALTDETGTGAAVFATTPTLVTPVLGVATATSINKVAITAPATSATLTIADGKTATFNHSITIAGTDSTTMTFPSTSAQVARIDAGQTFVGTQVFSSLPQISSLTSGRVPIISTSGTITDNAGLRFDTSGAQLTVIGNLGSATKGYVTLGNMATFNNYGAIYLGNAVSSTDFVLSGTLKSDDPNIYLNTPGGDLVITESQATNQLIVMRTTGYVGIGRGAFASGSGPTAKLHIAAGTTAAAPFKLTSGTNLTTAQAGAMEYNGTNLFFTRSGTTRENIITTSSVNSVSPTSPNRTLTVNIDGTTYYIHAKTTND